MFNPKGIVPTSPGLRGWPVRLGPSYPGSSFNKHSQPQRGCGHCVFVRRACENGHNPVGVVIFFGRFPRVARASQPCGSGTESRWDSRTAQARDGVMKSNRVRARTIPKRVPRRTASANPKGIAASSPRLAQRLPWVNVTNWNQPRRGCGERHARRRVMFRIRKKRALAANPRTDKL